MSRDVRVDMLMWELEQVRFEREEAQRAADVVQAQAETWRGEPPERDLWDQLTPRGRAVAVVALAGLFVVGAVACWALLWMVA